MKISDETLRQALRRDLEPVRLSPFVKGRILHSACRRRTRRPVRLLRRLAAVAAAVALCLVCSLGTLAAVPDLAVRLSTVSAETRALFTPVDEMCESEGIRMEVLAALNDGDTALFYLSLTDTTGQNRLDESLEAPELTVSGMDWAYCDNVAFDENGSAILRITAQNFGGRTPGKVSLHLGTLLTGRQDLCREDTGFTVADVQDRVPYPAITYPARRGGYSLAGDPQSPLGRQLDDDSLPLLAVQCQKPLTELPWFTLLGSGVVSGGLHVLAETAPEARYNRASFFLLDAAGQRYELPIAEIDRYDASGEGLGGVPRTTEPLRREYVCALPENTPPKEVRIGFEATSYQYIEGSWDATFRLKAPQDALTLACDFDQAPWRLTQVELGASGISFSGRGEMLESSLEPDFEILLKDGTVLKDYSAAGTSVSFSASGEDLILIKLLFDQPLDLAQVSEVWVNDVRLWQAEPAP